MSAPGDVPRILVTGSRTWDDPVPIRAMLEHWRQRLPGAVLVHGNARGADRLAAEIWRGWGLPTEEHRADWDRFGRAAGPIRNQAMVDVGAAVCLAFIRDASPGATGCAQFAEAIGIPTYRTYK